MVLGVAVFQYQRYSTQWYSATQEFVEVSQASRNQGLA